ncbi:unnamed protein product [Linum tenue]|uniref:Germin-like protein n=1 Tax=Linum tenue TaxID=586396 RepID=A0AAV0QIU3_9ROSI|nr:unnamed protein product [Linum tenue]
MEEFPALNGQGVSLAVLQLPVGCTYAPHSHPRAAEIILVVRGSIAVGLVGSDDGDCLYTQTLEAGDMFVFPKGLVHYGQNAGDEDVIAVSAYGSANAGQVSMPDSLFGSGIDDEMLADAFRTNVSVVQDIKAGFQ